MFVGMNCILTFALPENIHPYHLLIVTVVMLMRALPVSAFKYPNTLLCARVFVLDSVLIIKSCRIYFLLCFASYCSKHPKNFHPNLSQQMQHSFFPWRTASDAASVKASSAYSCSRLTGC